MIATGVHISRFSYKRHLPSLTIVVLKKSVLLNSVQEFIEIEASLLKTFFICLHI